MAVVLLDVFNQFFDDDGNPLDGGFVYTYAADGSTPQATYTDTDGAVPHENPIELLSNGRPPSPIFWTQGSSYNVLLKTAAAVEDDRVTLDSILSFQVVISADNEDFTPQNNTFVDAMMVVKGTTDGASDWLDGEIFVRSVTFAANFAGSLGKIPKTLPTAAFTVSLTRDEVEVGTASCSTAGVWTFTSTAGAVIIFAAGQELDFYGPAIVDATMADFGLTLKGALTA